MPEFDFENHWKDKGEFLIVVLGWLLLDDKFEVIVGLLNFSWIITFERR